MRLNVPANIHLNMRLRRYAILLTALACGVSLRAQGQGRSRRSTRDEPRPTIYRSADGGWRLDLPVEMEDALDRYDRDFESWSEESYRSGLAEYDFTSRQTPWAVVGDFNGDGRVDAAVAGRDDRDALVVFILSTGRNRYRAVEAEREPYDEEDPSSVRPPRLKYLYPGRYVIDDPRLAYPREILIEQPAVQLTAGRRPGAVLYVVERNVLTPYYLSDRPAPPPDRNRRGPAAVRSSGATSGGERR